MCVRFPTLSREEDFPVKRLLVLSLTSLLAWTCGPSDSVTAPGEGSLAISSQGVQVDVRPGHLDGWALFPTFGSTVAFERGPGSPPLGRGSAEFRVDGDGHRVQLRNSLYSGTPLADLTELEYWSYQESDQGEQAAYLALHLDLDGNLSTREDLIFFEPVYQQFAYGCGNANPVALNVWQKWDALGGCWWSADTTDAAGPGANVKTLAQYLADKPGARIMNPPGGGGVVLGAGRLEGNDLAGWENFVGNVDALSIANGSARTYNFELLTMDDCKSGGWRDYGFENQGQCVRYAETGKDSR